MDRRLLIAPLMLAGLPAAAQDGAETPARRADPGSAASAASDAFGERVGINQVGLYSETQTRGFDLMAGGGAFRIDGHYYHPVAIPHDSMVTGHSINVGIAAATLDLPSPTGVINYRLRDPGPGATLSVTTGLRDYESFHVEALGSVTSSDGAFGLLAHGLAIPDEQRWTGERGSWFSFGTVARWSPRPGTRLRLFGAYGRPDYGGNLTVLPADDSVPAALVPRTRYSPDWAQVSRRAVNYGVLAEHRAGDWLIGASAIRSQRRNYRNDVTVIKVAGDGQASGTLYLTPETNAWSNSYELKLARAFRWFGVEHLIGAAVRQRRSVTGRAEAFAISLGAFTLDRPPDVAEPDMPADGRRGRDQVDQRIVSATYGLVLEDALELRLGAHRNSYAKKAESFDGSSSTRRETSWLYSASAIWRPAPRLRLFASYVSGLEESGTAPAVATNRDEVLPPVKAVQYELGARLDIVSQLSLIAAAFDIRKPIYGLRADGLFAPAGTVRHRGVEVSLTGQVTPTTRLVLGANVLDPRNAGPLVDAGALQPLAPGVSRFNATLSVEKRVAPRWTADFYLLYEGKRRRDGRSLAELPGVPFTVVGTRYDLEIGRIPVALRTQIVNPIDDRGYFAAPSGGLVPTRPRTFRISIGTSL